MILTRVSWFSDSIITESATPDFTLPEVCVTQPVVMSKKTSKRVAVIVRRLENMREDSVGLGICLQVIIMMPHLFGGKYVFSEKISVVFGDSKSLLAGKK